MDSNSGQSGIQPSAASNSAENDGCPQIIVETTLALIKPDAVDRSEEIVDIILRSGFSVLRVSVVISVALLAVSPRHGDDTLYCNSKGESNLEPDTLTLT